MTRTLQQLVGIAMVSIIGFAARAGVADEHRVTLLHFNNDHGTSETLVMSPHFDTANAFFQSLGTNDRACITCHQPGNGWSVTPASLRSRFNHSDGFDPIL